MYLNFDELPDEQTLAASLAPLKQFRQHGMRAELAMQDDVNGIGWCFSEYFADAGVKYLNMGTHGHRALICFDKPTVFGGNLLQERKCWLIVQSIIIRGTFSEFTMTILSRLKLRCWSI